MKESIVSSFFFYMWNAWGKEECQTVFGSMADHFWEKWEDLYRKFRGGGAERFYAELSLTNRRLLVERACELYDGNRLRDTPRYSDKQPEKFPERLILVVGNAPQSLANLFMAGDIPFAFSSGRFIVFDSASPQVFREYLERRGVPPVQIEQMMITQREIIINNIPLS